MSIYDKASLVLIPSGTKTSKVYSQKPVNGDGDFTFSRSTAATRVNADGNIEKETQNLLTYSNDFTGWGIGGTLVGGQADKDGGTSAWSFTSSSPTSGLNLNITTGGVQTFSAYVKKNATNGLRLYMFGTNNASPYFNLNTGSVTSLSNALDATIVEYNSEWWRISVTVNSTLSSIYFYCTNNSTSQAVGTITIQDAQLEQGLVARDYIETTTAAVEGGITDNVPRLDYTDSSCPALLLEPQRTNLVTQSEYFIPNWNIQDVSVTTNSVNSPERVQNATTLTEDVTNQRHRVYYYINVTSGTDYTASVFVKKNSSGRFLLINANSAFNARAVVNLDTLEITNINGTNSKVEDYGDGWYRFSISGQASTTSSNPVFIQIQNAASDVSYLGDGSSLYLYGAQLEAGSYATSYIPTYGTSVTRNADSCSKTGVSDLIGQTEGTIFFEWSKDVLNFGSDYSYFQVGDYPNYVGIYIQASNCICEVVNSGAVQAKITKSSVSIGTHKAAVAYANNDIAFYFDGVQVGVDSLATIPSTSVFRLNANNGIAEKISQSLIFKTRLTNAELAALTTI